MTRAVLDTNVLASGFVRPEPPPGQLLARWTAGNFTLVASEHILIELTRTFEDSYFRRRLSPEQRRRNVDLIHRDAVLVAVNTVVSGVATHPEDDVILATAVDGRAEYLVTGDAKLQRLGSYGGITIVSPRAFLDLLNSASV